MVHGMLYPKSKQMKHKYEFSLKLSYFVTDIFCLHYWESFEYEKRFDLIKSIVEECISASDEDKGLLWC